MRIKISRLGMCTLNLATTISCGLKSKESDIAYKASNLTKESNICDGYQAGREKYKQNKYVESFEIWYPLAQNGCARAQTSLGALYELGKGVPRNSDLALNWFLKAAEKKEPYASYYLGWHYITEGKDYNQEKAKFWFEKAANSDLEDVRWGAKKLLMDFE